MIVGLIVALAFAALVTRNWRLYVTGRSRRLGEFYLDSTLPAIMRVIPFVQAPVVAAAWFFVLMFLTGSLGVSVPIDVFTAGMLGILGWIVFRFLVKPRDRWIPAWLAAERDRRLAL